MRREIIFAEVTGSDATTPRPLPFRISRNPFRSDEKGGGPHAMPFDLLTKLSDRPHPVLRAPSETHNREDREDRQEAQPHSPSDIPTVSSFISSCACIFRHSISTILNPFTANLE